MNKSSKILKTGKEWSLEFGLSVVNPLGWESNSEFDSLKIPRDEFLLRCSNSVIVPPKNLSRRDAFKLKKELLKKNV